MICPDCPRKDVTKLLDLYEDKLPKLERKLDETLDLVNRIMEKIK